MLDMIRSFSFSAHYLLLVGLLFSQASAAQDFETKIETYIQSYGKTNDFSGCILITAKDSTLYDSCFGYADFSVV